MTDEQGSERVLTPAERSELEKQERIRELQQEARAILDRARAKK